MAVRFADWVGQQAPTETPNGTNVTDVISNPELGPVGEFLHGFGIPYYDVLGALITFFIALFVIYSLGRATVVPFVSRLLNRRGLDAHERRPLVRLMKMVMVFVAIAIAFRIAGYRGLLTSIATIGAAATLAVGLALKDSISNFVAGVFIYTDRPFRIGDWIEWDAGTYAGIVEDITFRVTRVRTFDNELLTVPNSILTGDVIKNPVAKDELRLQFNFGIGYDDDVETATDIIVEEAETHPDILDDPAPTVRMTESSESDRGALADSYVGLTSRFWIADPNRADYLKVRGEYVTAVKERFDEAGIDIPFPQADLSGRVGVENRRRIESAE
ncbi:mechanosensitive ion channel family protein [Halococcus sediminicola]|uniref:mechanosensitive ion channel family protein n=1 Tax=Halococcus sediminicola TaxID=1264579 RepID=UPI000678645B|nr:mechanosensitive ion channel family protein [Halococcus sediminicola]